MAETHSGGSNDLRNCRERDKLEITGGRGATNQGGGTPPPPTRSPTPKPFSFESSVISVKVDLLWRGFLRAIRRSNWYLVLAVEV